MKFFFLLLIPFILEGTPRILVGSPIRQKATILNEFLISLNRLEGFDDYELHYCFIDDNTEEESKNILQKFADEKKLRCNILSPENKCNRQYGRGKNGGHQWNHLLIWKVANFKNQIIEKARNENFDYLFLIDSDILLAPQTLEQLISDHKEIVCNIFWTSWDSKSDPLPQVWLSDEYTLFEKSENEKNLTSEEKNKRTNVFLNMLKVPGVYEVGGLGACTLISQSAIQKGVSFKKIKNLSFWGEDRHFCVRAIALDIPLFVDTYYPAYHIYRDSDLEGVEEFMKKTEQ